MPDRRIKHCPFCNGYGKLRRKNRTVIKGETVRNTYVYCPLCDVRGSRVLYMNYDTGLEAEEQAIALWNRRAKNE